MRKSKDIKALFEGGSKRLTDLKTRSRERSNVLTHVLAALPERLAGSVVSAGVDRGRLTVGVTAGAWATRLRYLTETLRREVGRSLGAEIESVRIKVVQPAA